MIEWFGETLWAAWLALTFVLLVLELLMLDLLFLMLAAGGAAATTVALASGPAWLQVVLGSATALLMIGAVRPIALKHLKKGPPEQLTNVDRMAGMSARVLETTTDDTGLAEVEGETWTARAVHGETLEAGHSAVVDSVDGATVYLKPVHEIDWGPESRMA